MTHKFNRLARRLLVTSHNPPWIIIHTIMATIHSAGTRFCLGLLVMASTASATAIDATPPYLDLLGRPPPPPPPAIIFDNTLSDYAVLQQTPSVAQVFGMTTSTAVTVKVSHAVTRLFVVLPPRPWVPTLHCSASVATFTVPSQSPCCIVARIAAVASFVWPGQEHLVWLHTKRALASTECMR